MNFLSLQVATLFSAKVKDLPEFSSLPRRRQQQEDPPLSPDQHRYALVDKEEGKDHPGGSGQGADGKENAEVR